VLFTANNLLLSDVDKRAPLRDIIGFAALGDEALTAIAAAATRRQYEAGTTILRADEPRTVMHLLVDGDLDFVRMGRTWPHPDRRVLDVFWLARDTMPLAIETRGGATVLELPLDGLDEILEDHFDLWLATAQAMATWLLAVRGKERLELARHDGDASVLSQRIGALQDALPFARGFVDALMQLDEEAIIVRVDAGKVLWRPGDPADYFFVPVAGELHGVADEPFGIGGLELLANRSRVTRVEVTQPLTALRIGREALLDLMEDHHELARDLLAAVAAAVVQLVDEGAPLPAKSRAAGR
jgi:hypothetical protein